MITGFYEVETVFDILVSWNANLALARKDAPRICIEPVGLKLRIAVYARLLKELASLPPIVGKVYWVGPCYRTWINCTVGVVAVQNIISQRSAHLRSDEGANLIPGIYPAACCHADQTIS